MRRQEYGSVESSAVSQRTFHVVALVAIVFVALTLAFVVPEGLGSAGNRTLEGATPIASLPFREEIVDATFAGVEPDGPLPSCAAVENSFWYVFSPEADTPLSVRAVPGQAADTAFGVALAAWTLQPDGTLSEAGCVNQRGAGAPEQLVLAVAGQGTHYLQIGTDINAAAPAVSLTFLADVQEPEHDLFAFARPVGTTQFSDSEVDAIDARRERAEPTASCAELVATTWYRLSAPQDAILSASVVPAVTAGNAMDVAVAVYAGDAIGTLTETGCVDAGGVQEPEHVEVPLDGGQEYAIQVGAVLGVDAWPGIFSLSIAGRQTIELRPVSDTVFGAEPSPLDAEADSGLPVTFEASGPCRILEGALVSEGAGTCTVTASQPGDTRWAPALPVILDVDIARASQAIAFGPQPDTVFGAEPSPLDAEADSGLPVTFEASGPCRILEGALVSEGAGTCTLTASQPGDLDWEAAPPVILDIDIARADQTIEVDAIESAVVGEPLPLDAEADSGLPVTFEASGPCRILEGALIGEGAGTCTVTAAQAGDVQWQPAAPVTVTVPVEPGRQTIELGAVPDTAFGAQPLPLSAVADSGLPVVFETSGPCRAAGGALVLEGAGLCTVTASQPGDIDWLPADPVTTKVRIAQGRQTIELRPVSDTVFGAEPSPLDAEADSGLPVTFEASGPCRILEGALVSEGAGTCTVTASQPGDTRWAPALPVILDVDIARASQAIAFGPQPDTVFGAEPSPLDAEADSGLPVTFEASGPCRILEGALVSEGAGTCTLTASQPGDLDWEAAPPVILDIDIARADQAIEVDAIESAVVGEPLPLDAEADSGLPVTFEAAGACIAEGTTVRPVGSGTCTITASQPGDSDWQPADAVILAVRVGRGRQTIEVGAIDAATVGEPLPLSAVADSGLPVVFETSGPCRAVDGALALEAAGLCAVTASQSGDIDWQPAEPVTVTVRIDRGRQTIAFDPIDEVVVGGSVPLSAEAESGLPVTFEASHPCRILAGALVSDVPGTCTVTASQSGDIDWAPAPDVTLDVDVARATQAIEFDPVTDMVFGAEPLSLEAEADSGLPVTFVTDGPCAVVDGELASRGAGICSVTASQPGDDMWEPADEVRRVFRVARAPQTISFEAIGPRILGDPPIELEAAASSGLPVTYSATGPCVIEQGTLTLLDDGECSVSAFQAGNTDWAAAREVLRSFSIDAPD